MERNAASRVALVGVAVSVALAVVKIFAGTRAHSVAVVSDGIESAGDFVGSLIVWFGLRAAQQPADEDHPYGHGRLETLLALGIGALLVTVGAGIGVGAMMPRDESQMPHSFAIWVMLGAVLVKSALAVVKMQVGKKTNNAALIADAIHDNVDILSGVVALVSLTLATLVPAWHAADHYGGVVIGAIVIFMGARIIRETALDLMDTMPSDQQMSTIRATALQVPGARAVEKCFARRTGARYHVDLHLEVDAALTVRESHEIARSVKHRLRRDLDWVEDVLVHVEPYEPR